MVNNSTDLTAALGEGEESSSWGIVDILTLLLVFFIILYVNELDDGAGMREGVKPAAVAAPSPTPAPAAATDHATDQGVWRDNPYAAPHPLMLEAAARRAEESGMAGMVGDFFAGHEREGFQVADGDEGKVTLIIEESLAFASGSDELDRRAHAILDQLVWLLAREEGWEVRVAGHSDDRPIANERFASNWHLSTARAVSVVEYLLAGGLDPTRVTAEGHAEFRPLFANDSAANRARNRRVEITLLR